MQQIGATFNLELHTLSGNYLDLEKRVKILNNKIKTLDAKRTKEFKEKILLDNRLDALLDLLPVGVVVLDPNGVVCQCNPAAREILGIDLIGCFWSVIIKELYAPRIDDGLEVSLKNGKRISVSTRVLDNNPGQIIVLNDLTQTRVLQTKLSQQKRLLSMGKMIAFISHQIRTPLASMMLYVSHLCNKKLPIEQKNKFILNIKERLEHLDNLIESMLIFVKGGVAILKKHSTSSILISAQRSINDLILKYKANFIICNTMPNAIVTADKRALVAAIGNLIDNSVQASGDAAKIGIIVKQYNNSQLEIIVSDNGPGIDENNLPHVMNAFYTTKSGGTGLGLAVVKVVAESCGGSISIVSSRKSGTKVSIRLPYVLQSKKDI